MKIYDTFDRENPPMQGEVYVARDTQKRCWPESWIVAIYWNPDTWKSTWDGTKYTTCPEIDIITRGIFWHKEDAMIFAKALERIEELEAALDHTPTERVCKHDWVNMAPNNHMTCSRCGKIKW